jgi:hypothetical protein
LFVEDSPWFIAFICCRFAGQEPLLAPIVADQRIVAGLNFEGKILGSALTTKHPNPFALVPAPGQNQSDPSWATFWEQLQGKKLQLEVNGTAYHSFTDLPYVAKLFNITTKAPVSQVLGTIDGDRLLDVVPSYLAAFFGAALLNQTTPVLQGPVADFPEVLYRNSSGNWK